jgi:hypothetical protein
MKYLATYVLFVIAISALALSGNKIFFFLANLYQYAIYIVVAAIVVIIVGYNFIPDKY